MSEESPPPKPSPIHTFRLGMTGLRRLLGSLEADVMEQVWHLTAGDPTSWTTIGVVNQAVAGQTHYKTVQTIMNHLVEKGLLLRRERQRAYEYQPALSRDAFVAQATRDIVTGLVQDFGDIAVTQFVQVLHATDPEQVALLEHLMAAPPQPTPGPDDGTHKHTPRKRSS